MWLWIVIGVMGLGLFVFASPIIALAALVVLVTGIVGLVRNTPTWLRFRSRTLTVIATVVAALVFFASGSLTSLVYPSAQERTVTLSAATDERTAPPVQTRTPRATPTPVVEEREEVVSESIAFERTSVEDGTIPRGETRLVTAGADGERSLTYRVTLRDGEEISRELISEAITLPPVSEVTAIGTFDPPPPPPPAAPQSSGCHASYADACVPIDSDVDCTGGSGNGPSYLHGTARVVGPDVYDLDRNNDGIACN